MGGQTRAVSRGWITERRAWLLAVTLAALTAGCGEAGSCASTADCAFLNGGNPCLGTYVCAKDRCTLDPKTVVVCDAAGDSVCQANLCQADTGACAMTPRSEGAPCDDGEPCSLGDRCSAGSCVSGSTQVCDCAEDADCDDDGDLCNGTPRCDTSAFPARCVVDPKTVVSCSASTDPCQAASCDPKTGKCKLEPVGDGAPCDDGDACTAGDTCAKGACTGKTDTCSCAKTSDCVDADSNPCTGVPFCDTSGGAGVCKLNPATVVVCSPKSDTACTQNQCNPATGACQLAAVADDKACDDGDACTKGEVCVAGTCAAGTNVCKCASDSDCKDKDDGDACNGTLFCNKQTGSCEENPGSVVTCATVDDTDCAKNVCDPKTGTCAVLARSAVKLVGCVDVNLGGLVGKQCLWAKASQAGAGPFACDDGSVCTVGDTCKGTTCAAGKATCECVADSDCANKDDGDACNGVPFCDKSTGTCKANPASVVYCDKSQDADCLKAQCDPKTGKCSLQPVKPGTTCDDGKVCTTGESCTAAGTCTGKAASCDDGKACTTDTCSATLGCVHKAVVCDDGNECTTEACDTASGKCKVPSPVGTSVQCEADGNGCTVADHCDGKGACVAGTQASCAQPSKACQVASCKSVSPSKFECVVTAAPKGAPCDDGDPCFDKSVCVQGQCKLGTVATLWQLHVPQSADSAQTVGSLVDSAGAVSMLRTTPSITGAAWTLLKYDVQRKPVHAALKVAAPSGQPLGPAVALVRLGSGTVGIVGPMRVGKTWRAAVAQVSDDGKQGAWVTLTSAASTKPTGAIRHVSGNLVVAEHIAGTGGGNQVRMVSVAGKELWKIDLDARPFAPKSVRLMSTADGGVFSYIVTSVAAKSVNRSLLHATGSGKTVWEIIRAYPEQPVHVAGVFPLTAGRFHALVNEMSGSTYWGSWNSASPEPDPTNRTLQADFAPLDAVRHDGGVFALGSDGKGPALARYDALGNRQWLRSLSVASTIKLRHLRVDAPRERLLLTGDSVDESKSDTSTAVAIAVSFRGESSCAARGVCAGKAWGTCDDDNPCTADSCSAIAGCVHTPPSSAVCTLETGCSAYGQCAGGSCAEPTYGRIFAADTSALVAPDYESKGRFTLSPDKGVVHAWSGEVSKSSTALRSYAASLTTGALSFGGPPVISCKGMTRLDDLVRRPDGTVLALGAFKNSKGLQVAGICHASPGWKDYDLGNSTGGSVVLLEASNCASCPLDARGIALHSNGDVMVAVNSTYSGGTGQLWRLDKDLKTLFNETSDGSVAYVFNGVTSTALGDAVGVGYAGNTEVSRRPLFVRRTSQGQVAASVVLTGVVGGGLWDVQPTKTGDLIGVGTVVHSDAARSSLALGLTTAGKVLWTHVPTLADQGLLKAVVALDDGYVAAGLQIVGGPEQLVLTRRTNLGALMWSRSHALAGSQSLDLTRGSLLRTSLGTYAMGARVGKNPRYPMWIHASRHGFVSCAAAGKCTAAKTTCDDKNPCTADWCEPDVGCKHTPLSALACGTNGTCAAGVCK